MINPYQAPTQNIKKETEKFSIKFFTKVREIFILSVLALLSVFMAIIDSVSVFPHKGTGLIELAAILTVLGHLPGIVVTYLLKKPSRLFFTVFAILASTNLAIWTLYFFSDKSYTTSVGQTHFIIFPIVFLFFALVIAILLLFLGFTTMNNHSLRTKGSKDL